MKSFSIFHNLPILFSLKESKNPDNVNCFDGIRVLSLMWMIWGHSLFKRFGQGFFSNGPDIQTVCQFNIKYLNFSNNLIFFKWIKTRESNLFTSMVLGVDTFLFISGFLVTVTVMNSYEKKLSDFQYFILLLK